MKYTVKFISFIFIAYMLVSCENDLLKGFDVTSPQAVVPVDTFEVDRATVITLRATLTDESGIGSYNLTYSTIDIKELQGWEIDVSADLKELNYPKRYEFSADILIPDVVATSWEENYQKNDGTIFRITQTYHKLALTFYDIHRNKNTEYFYIKVKD